MHLGGKIKTTYLSSNLYIKIIIIITKIMIIIIIAIQKFTVHHAKLKMFGMNLDLELNKSATKIKSVFKTN